MTTRNGTTTEYVDPAVSDEGDLGLGAATADASVEPGAGVEADPDEIRVEQLTVEIEATRDDLTDTVEAIGQKLEPSNLAREATETARQATIGKVEQMTTGLQETWRDVRTGNAAGIVETIKSNPLPSALVGIGLGMLFMNRGAEANRDWSVSNGARRDAGSDRSGGYGYGSGYATSGPNAGGGIGSTIGDVRDQAGETIGRATDRAGQTIDRAGQTIDRMTSTVGDAASALPQQVGHIVDQQGGQVRRLIDDSPLAAGIVALATGAVIGMLIPTTQVERQAIGQQRDDLIGQAQGAIDETLDSVGSSDRSSGGQQPGTGM
jgi:ElaB/YqjD/DUF883 family membrane-anchored ribosome-binding protein